MLTIYIIAIKDARNKLSLTKIFLSHCNFIGIIKEKLKSWFKIIIHILNLDNISSNTLSSN